MIDFHSIIYPIVSHYCVTYAADSLTKKLVEALNDVLTVHATRGKPCEHSIEAWCGVIRVGGLPTTRRFSSAFDDITCKECLQKMKDASGGYEPIKKEED